MERPYLNIIQLCIRWLAGIIFTITFIHLFLFLADYYQGVVIGETLKRLGNPDEYSILYESELINYRGIRSGLMLLFYFGLPLLGLILFKDNLKKGLYYIIFMLLFIPFYFLTLLAKQL